MESKLSLVHSLARLAVYSVQWMEDSRQKRIKYKVNDKVCENLKTRSKSVSFWTKGIRHEALIKIETDSHQLKSSNKSVVGQLNDPWCSLHERKRARQWWKVFVVFVRCYRIRSSHGYHRQFMGKVSNKSHHHRLVFLVFLPFSSTKKPCGNLIIFRSLARFLLWHDRNNHELLPSSDIYQDSIRISIIRNSPSLRSQSVPSTHLMRIKLIRQHKW